jgi:hypothetical protein
MSSVLECRQLSGEKLWFVAEWIEPLEPVTKDLEGAKHLCYALGEFHRLMGMFPHMGLKLLRGFINGQRPMKRL